MQVRMAVSGLSQMSTLEFPSKKAHRNQLTYKASLNYFLAFTLREKSFKQMLKFTESLTAKIPKQSTAYKIPNNLQHLKHIISIERENLNIIFAVFFTLIYCLFIFHFVDT